ncbi:hypothetical protein KKC94_02010 [Patescibacteria group bacterium]|nr:hypothetical protein [Patescibacteria group bacterium]
MIWQDLVITIVNIVFTTALLPQVYHGFKEKIGPIKLQTSIPTFLGCYTLAICFLTLSLPFSAAVTFLSGSMWFLLFLQRLIYKRHI